MVPILQHAISEYHSHSQPIGDRLSGPFENSLALLDRMVAALDAYMRSPRRASPWPLPKTSDPEFVGSAAAGTPAAVQAPAEPSQKVKDAAEPTATEPSRTEEAALGATAQPAES